MVSVGARVTLQRDAAARGQSMSLVGAILSGRWYGVPSKEPRNKSSAREGPTKLLLPLKSKSRPHLTMVMLMAMIITMRIEVMVVAVATIIWVWFVVAVEMQVVMMGMEVGIKTKIEDCFLGQLLL